MIEINPAVETAIYMIAVFVDSVEVILMEIMISVGSASVLTVKSTDVSISGVIVLVESVKMPNQKRKKIRTNFC